MSTELDRDQWRKLIATDPVAAYRRVFGPRWAAMFELIPRHMQGVVARYMILGDRPGDFLYAVVCNSLIDSFACADDVNRKALLTYATFLHEAAPPDAFRSHVNVERWIAQGGALASLPESVDGEQVAR